MHRTANFFIAETGMNAYKLYAASRKNQLSLIL